MTPCIPVWIAKQAQKIVLQPKKHWICQKCKFHWSCFFSLKPKLSRNKVVHGQRKRKKQTPFWNFFLYGDLIIIHKKQLKWTIAKIKGKVSQNPKFFSKVLQVAVSLSSLVCFCLFFWLLQESWEKENKMFEEIKKKYKTIFFL